MTSLPENLPHVLQIAEPFVQQYGYYGLALLIFLENLFIPVPGETSMVTAAIFAGVGDLNIFLVMLVAFSAAVLGDNLAFYLGRIGAKKLIIKYGKYVFVTKDRYKKFELFYDKNGTKVVLIGRFIDGLRQLNGILAGSSDMPWKRFFKFNTIGAAIWVVFWCTIGYYGGNHIAIILKYQAYVIIVAILSVLVYIAWKIYKRKQDLKTHP